MMKLTTFILATFLTVCTYANELVITVWCTNGTPVSGLWVHIQDANRNPLFEGETNNLGQITMMPHIAPIYMTFSARDGSTCGPFGVNLNDPNEPTTGTVTLQYYPVNGRCGCARFSH